MPPANHGGSTSEHRRIGSPHTSGGVAMALCTWLAQVALTDGRIAASLDASLRRGHKNKAHQAFTVAPIWAARE